jgi:hypothetical protein
MVQSYCQPLHGQVFSAAKANACADTAAAIVAATALPDFAAASFAAAAVTSAPPLPVCIT